MVLWSDEAPFQLFKSKGRLFVPRDAHEKYKNSCLRKTIKHGGGTVDVWGCFSTEGIGTLCRLTRIMDADYYQEILESALSSHPAAMTTMTENR